ncbi:MAG: ribonuclease P protein component 1 [Candidatus Micrarchaeota archaeon]
MITRENILIHELIGLRASVVRSACRNLIGAAGLVVDETKNMLVLEARGGAEKRIPKNSCVFRFELPETRGKKNETADVDGALICYAPENRPKKIRLKR